MVSKTLALFFVLVFFIYGCATQQPQPEETADTTNQELAEIGNELDEFQDGLQELANSLNDAEETDDLQMLEVSEDLFA